MIGFISNRRGLTQHLTLVLLLASLSAFGVAAPKDPQLPAAAERQIEYESDVLPILKENCYSCHGPKKQEGELRVDRRASLLKGGDSGEPALLTGNSAKSQMIRFVAGLDEDYPMPPEGDRLTAKQISILRAWIDQGAKWPGQDQDVQEKLDANRWSFQPVARPEPPSSERWGVNAIDAFVYQKLTEAGLQPSAEADRVTLIRRLFLDMHGLPPTPEQVDAFLGDSSPRAYARLVDQVLKSPRYGERWARHWLDVVRFAESNGFETNRERPNAYHYRDYVIQAFNNDKPYDRFILEQLAGDAAGEAVGTGFLVAGPYDLVKSPDINLTLMQRQNELDDMINTTGTAFLGLTLGCARCHNHKFDPITQTDYYSLQAVFAGVQHGERMLPAEDNEKTKQEAEAADRQLAAAWMELSKLLPAARPAVNPKHNVEYFDPIPAKFVRFTIKRTNASEPCLDELEVFAAARGDEPARNVALASAGAVATASGVYLDGANPLHQLEHIHDGKYGNEKSWIAKNTISAWIQIELPQEVVIDRVEWARDRNAKYSDRLAIDYQIEVALQADQWRRVASSADHAPAGDGKGDRAYRQARIARLDADQQAAALQLSRQIDELQERLRILRPLSRMAYVGSFQQPAATHRLYRGDPMAKREEVGPDAVAVIGSLALEKNTPEQQRRLALARWIANPSNPLTARVMVNRLWHYHFGTGIAPTPSDFGGNGQPPSHPALLDWLAAEFMEQGWSVKHMQRLILLSSTYRQSSLPRREALAKDASCRLLWRFPPRRLEAEAIRDSVLQVSGDLDLSMGGPGFSLFDVQLENVRHYFPKQEFGPAEWRRMIYMTKYRMEQDAVFGSFDCPDGSQVMPRRSRSTTPLQALNLLNSSFMLQQAEHLAERLKRSAGPNPQDQTKLAFRLCFGRDPDPQEQQSSQQLIAAHDLKTLCRALLNANEFLFIP